MCLRNRHTLHLGFLIYLLSSQHIYEFRLLTLLEGKGKRRKRSLTYGLTIAKGQ